MATTIGLVIIQLWGWDWMTMYVYFTGAEGEKMENEQKEWRVFPGKTPRRGSQWACIGTRVITRATTRRTDSAPWLCLFCMSPPEILGQVFRYPWVWQKIPILNYS